VANIEIGIAIGIGVGLSIRETQIDPFQKPTPIAIPIPSFSRFVLEFPNNGLPERPSLSGLHGHRPWV
jgi:hypothetical protein